MNSFKEEGYDNGFNDGVTQKKYEIARKMLSMNMSVEDISEITQMSIDELERLKNDLN